MVMHAFTLQISDKREQTQAVVRWHQGCEKRNADIISGRTEVYAPCDSVMATISQLLETDSALLPVNVLSPPLSFGWLNSWAHDIFAANYRDQPSSSTM